jgi:predicted nucleotidyltransferase
MSRKAAREKILTTSSFRCLVREVMATVGEKYGLALIGGIAVSHYANPPATPDVDFLVDGLLSEFLDDAEGFFYPPCKFERFSFEQRGLGLIQNMVRVGNLSKDLAVDFLLTGSDPYLSSVVENAVMVELQPNLELPVARVEDVILLKMKADRHKDAEDIAALYLAMEGRLDLQYIERMWKELKIK